MVLLTPVTDEWSSVRAFLMELTGQYALCPFLDLDESYFNVSAGSIRDQCAVRLTTLPSQSRATGPLRAIRAACRRFTEESHTELADFFTSLGALRTTIGLHVAVLAELYGLDIPIELATILPAEDTVKRGDSTPDRSSPEERDPAPVT
jgi:hypothetical protein